MLNEPPCVSVVIAAWNAERFIWRAVESALAQNGCGSLEIIVVDDCSTDQTFNRLVDIGGRFPNVVYAKTSRNSGPGAARNVGIALAKGAWIAILDADDAFDVGRLARLIDLAEADCLDVIADLPILFDLAAEERAPTQLRVTGDLEILSLEALLKPDPVSGLDLGLLKPIFRSSLFIDGRIRYREDILHGEDHRLYIDLIRSGAKFGFLREARYVFSTRVGEITGSYSPGSVTNVDYRAVARQALELKGELESCGELTDALAIAIDGKVSAAFRNNRVYGWTAFRKRDWRRVSAWLLQDYRNALELSRIGIRKILGHRGLPD